MAPLGRHPHDGRRTAATATLLLEALAVAAAYAVLAVVAMAPLFDDLGGATLDPDRRWLSGWIHDPRIAATSMLRDIRLFVWVYAWDWHALLTQPGSLFQANVFHPAPDALAYSEHALGKVPITGPLFALGGNAVFAHQADLLLTFALSGAAMYALARAVGASRAAALLAGLVYAFNPARRDSLYHSYLLAGQWLPLALLGLDRTLFDGRLRWAVLFAAALLLHLCSSYYLAYQGVAALAAYGAAVLWTTGARIPARGLRRAAGAAALVAVPFVAVSLPYLRTRGAGTIPDYAALVPALFAYSNDPWRSYLVPTLALLGDLAPPLARGAHAYVGAVALPLAIAGCLGGRQLAPATRRLRAAAIAIVVVAWVLALGPAWGRPDGPPLPYAAAMHWIPGFDSMRVPARFALTSMAGLALLAGLGADRLLRRAGGRWGPAGAAALAASLGVAIAVDYGLGVERYETRPFPVGLAGPPVYRHLATLPRGPVLELPLTEAGGLRASAYMVYSTVHWMPLVNGTSGYVPPSQRIMREVALRLPDPAALRTLGRMTGLRWLVVHRAALPGWQRARWRRPAGLRLVRRFGDDLLWEVVAPPRADLVPAMRACARHKRACATLGARVARALGSQKPVARRAAE